MIKLGQIRFIPYRAFEPRLNMALDHLLLSQGQMALRFYGWQRPCLSLGRNQHDFSDLNASRLKGNEVDLVRRETGGQAVLHDRELTYSFVGANPPFPKQILESYRLLSIPILRALQDLKILAQSGDYRKFKPEGSHCFLEPSAYEIVVEGKKLIGSAQRRRGNCFLQHGAVLLQRNLDLWQELWPQADLSRFTSLAELGLEISPEELSERIKEAFEQGLGINFKEKE